MHSRFPILQLWNKFHGVAVSAQRNGSPRRPAWAEPAGGDPLDRLTVFRLCAELEGHPDNAAPASFGGFTVVPSSAGGSL